MKSTNKINNPHDKYFKLAFSHRDLVIDFIRVFVPNEVRSKIDLRTIKKLDTSYITEGLETFFSDVVYAVKYRTKTGIKETKLCFLLEHKSHLESFVEIQLLRYMLERWLNHVINKEELELIVPVIVYHGKKKWEKKSLRDLILVPDEYFRKFIPNFEYLLVDISILSDSEILSLKAAAKLQNSLMALRFGRDRAYVSRHFAKILNLYTDYIQSIGGKNFFDGTIVYLMQTTKFSNTEAKQVFKQLDSSLKKEAMSTYDNIIQAGIEQGIEQGKHKITLNTIKKMIQQGFEDNQILALFTTISQREIDSIRKEMKK